MADGDTDAGAARVRTESADVVVTLTPPRAQELARLVRLASGDATGWQADLARLLAAAASSIAVPPQPASRRPLRMPLETAARMVPAPRVAPAEQSPRRPGPPPVTGPARRAARLARTSQPVRRPPAPQPAPAGSGLAAAMARLAEALSLTTEATAPPASTRRKPSSRSERATALQDILESASTTV